MTASPPANLTRSILPTALLPAGTALYRIHDVNVDPLWSGPYPGGPRNGFDDPDREFGVCYFGLSREAAFAETFLRRPPVWTALSTGAGTTMTGSPWPYTIARPRL